TTAGAAIRYTTDGTDPTATTGTLYSGPVSISSTTTLKAIAYAEGFLPSLISTATYSIPVSVENIAELRAQTTGSNVYTLTGEAILTFQQSSRNQKYIQDATGAILIDDNAGNITTTYNLYDGITGISGTLTLYSNLLQFVPVADPGEATSSNNVVEPEVRTLASLSAVDQAKLIKVMNVAI
ncbi:MAG: chitobiase/beta-hexosaminidase C-terminal domain-containing protein, partial [Candidatus Cloacimonetes bacterium]|nr:chitobiase/beta-hexosaminidase C-terminal domain-containing protein [Candidatus Cloacimonadota bacterium]